MKPLLAIRHDAPLTSVVFSPDGRIVATGSFDRTVILWDTGNGNRIRTLRGHSGSPWAVACSPDGNSLVSAGYGPCPAPPPTMSGEAISWDVQTGRPKQFLGVVNRLGAVMATKSVDVQERVQIEHRQGELPQRMILQEL